MINLTTLLSGESQPADYLRYGRGHGAPKTAGERRPIVVWNITRSCNLKCLHCYSDSDAKSYAGELDWDQCKAVVDDLAAYGVPGLLLSGGEPLAHPQVFKLADYAKGKGLRLTLSTNGTLITPDKAILLKQIGFAYVGISLDGIGATHDHFRGRQGAFDAAVNAFRHCRAAGQRVGLRLTLTKHTIGDIDGILDFIEKENIDRVCFYHLVNSGRGADLTAVTHEDTRHAIDTIMAKVKYWHQTGQKREVLTVAQPADGPYLLLKLAEANSPRLEEVRQLLQWNGGGNNGPGTGIANIDSQGNVHPDQFWQGLTLGNVKEKPFSEIWGQSTDPVLLGLRNRRAKLKGRCQRCTWQEICGGGFRVRAWQHHGDPWQEDPGCYLNEEEIAQASAEVSS